MLLHTSIASLLVAMIASVFSFGGLATQSSDIAHLVFFVFFVMGSVTFFIDTVKNA
ncbi:MAG: DUF1328 family protein [Brachymonas sp.]|nr:DUF1328 family protein [Brachymonas sp.]